MVGGVPHKDVGSEFDSLGRHLDFMSLKSGILLDSLWAMRIFLGLVAALLVALGSASEALAATSISLSGIAEGSRVVGTNVPGIRAITSGDIPATVSFYLDADSTAWRVESGAPYCAPLGDSNSSCLPWDSTKLLDGNHSVVAVARSSAGLELGRSAALPFVVDNVPDDPQTPVPPTGTRGGINAPGPFEFNGTNLSAWSSQQTPPRTTGRITQVTDQGSPALRFELRPGDPALTPREESVNARAEVLYGSDNNLPFREGEVVYFGWSTKFEAGFPSPGTGGGTSPGGHAAFIQWKGQGTGGPPIGLDTRYNVLQFGYATSVTGGKCGGWNTPLVRAGWNDFVVKIKFSTSASLGTVDLWHRSPVEENLTQKVVNCRMATLKSGTGGSYLKQGYYRKNVDERNVGVILHRGMRVGSTFAAVSAF